MATNLIAACAHPAWPTGLFSLNQQLDYVLAGGDDYELAFTAPGSARQAVQTAAQASQTLVTRIGQIDAAPGLRLVDGAGQPLADPSHFRSFDHFA